MRVNVKYRYIYEDVDRHGNVLIYFWRGKGHRKVRLREKVGSPEFHREYQTLAVPNAARDEREAKPKPPTPNTFRWLCLKFFDSTDFKLLDPKTQHVRRQVLEHTWDEPIAPGANEKFGDFPLSRMTAKAVRVLRNRKSGFPEAANVRIKAIRRVFVWAMENEIANITSNPARDVAYMRNASQGYHTWTVAEVEQYEATHAIGTKARLALALLLYTGTRRSDVVRLGRQHVRAGWITFTAQKNINRKPVTIEVPMLPVLQSIIEASPTGDLTYLVTDYGQPFTPAGFGGWFREQCDKAGLKHCSAHGLRKAGASIAAENGASPHQLMAIFGWLTLKEAERYTQAARRRRMARAGMGFLVRKETEDEQIFPTSDPGDFPTD
jgi:integrase